MDRRYAWAVFAIVLLACVQIFGCGGGSGTKPLIVSNSPLPDGTVGITYGAVLRASGGTAPYTWSQLSGGDMPPGITLGSAGNFSGVPTKAGTYGPYVFEATDSANDVAMTSGLSIVVNSSSVTVITSSLPNGFVGTPYSVALTESGGLPPYTWAVSSGGNLPPGLSLSSAGTISGTPTTVGSYGPYVFTVTDSASNTASSGNLTIAVTSSSSSICAPAKNEAALSASTPYAFLLKGTDGNGNPIVIAGSFTPNGSGGITSATADYNGFTNGPEPLVVNLASSSYSFSSSAQGCLYLAFSGLGSGSDSKKGDSGTASQRKAAISGQARKLIRPETAAVPISSVQFGFYLGGFDGTIYHTGRIIESDNTTGTGTNASGQIEYQNPSTFNVSNLASNFAFGVDGWTAGASAIVRTAIAGSFTNSAGTVSAGFADVNLGGTASGELNGGYGTLNSTIDANGRGTGTVFLTTPSGNLTFDFAFYVVNGSDILLISTDLASQDATTPLLAGRALGSDATYPIPPLNGNYILAAEGLQSLGTNLGNTAEIGTFSATNSGAIPTATIYSNDAGTYASNQYPSSSYSVEELSGRASITGVTSFPPVVYLTAGASSDDGIVGFAVGTDPQTSSGVLLAQTAGTPSYSPASITGNYASSTEEDIDGLNGAFLGGFVFNGTGAYTVTSQVTGTVTNVPSQGSITVNADGSGNLDGGTFPLVTNGNVIFAIPSTGDPLLFVLISGTLP